ncbi:MAG TPA: hypothetical protein VOA87_12270 [Thermoanaerobaculia bacterium]|nr:hypothetical protein [Thermoanaerobaculia bacterium]
MSSSHHGSRAAARLPLLLALLLAALGGVSAQAQGTARPAAFSQLPWASQLEAAQKAAAKVASGSVLGAVTAFAPNGNVAQVFPDSLTYTSFQLFLPTGNNVQVSFSDERRNAEALEAAGVYVLSAQEFAERKDTVAGVRISPAEALRRTLPQGRDFVLKSHRPGDPDYFLGPFVKLLGQEPWQKLHRPPIWVVEYSGSNNEKLALWVDARTGDISAPPPKPSSR